MVFEAQVAEGGLEVLKWKFLKIGGPQYRPQYTIVLIIGTPKKVPLILGNPQMEVSQYSGFGDAGDIQGLQGINGEFLRMGAPRAPAICRDYVGTKGRGGCIRDSLGVTWSNSHMSQPDPPKGSARSRKHEGYDNWTMRALV